MRINGGIAIIVAGAIIAFAIRDTTNRLNLNIIGIVIMLGGAVGLWFSYRLASGKDEDEVTLIKPTVEEQYTTAPHEYAIQERIDVTPSHVDLPPKP